jgi:hypothetical protein
VHRRQAHAACRMDTSHTIAQDDTHDTTGAQTTAALPACTVHATLVDTVGAVSCADIVNGGGKWPAPNSKSIGVTVRSRTGLTAHICVCHSGREYRNTHVQRKRDPCWLLRPTCKPGTAQCMLHMRKSPAAQCWCMPCHVGWLPGATAAPRTSGARTAPRRMPLQDRPFELGECRPAQAVVRLVVRGLRRTAYLPRHKSPAEPVGCQQRLRSDAITQAAYAVR